MRCLARTSLGLLGLALIAPGAVEAQYSPPTNPPVYQPIAPSAATAPAPVPVGLDGRPIPVAPPVEAPHQHNGRGVCAACVAKMQAKNPAQNGKIVACAHWKGGDSPTICAKCQSKFGANNNTGLPMTVVGCAHSKNGVCTACRAALNMPGQLVTAPQPGEVPGRAVASGSPSPSAYDVRTGRPIPSSAYDTGLGEPAPVGVVQANFSQPAGPMGYSPANPPQAMAPGRAVAESSPSSSNLGNDPYQAKSGPFPHPHILGHLFGWSGLGAEKKEAKAWKKAEAHASITYDADGNPGPGPVDELPASTVFGKKR